MFPKLLLYIGLLFIFTIKAHAEDDTVFYTVIEDNPTYYLKSNFSLGFNCGFSANGFRITDFSELFPLAINGNYYLSKKALLSVKLRQGFLVLDSALNNNSNTPGAYHQYEFGYEWTINSKINKITVPIWLSSGYKISNGTDINYVNTSISPECTQLESVNLRGGMILFKTGANLSKVYMSVSEYGYTNESWYYTPMNTTCCYFVISNNKSYNFMIKTDKYGYRSSKSSYSYGVDALLAVSIKVDNPIPNKIGSFATTKYVKVSEYNTSNIGIRGFWTNGMILFEGGKRPGANNDIYCSFSLMKTFGLN